MAGGTITRITGGTFATELSGGMTIYTDNFDMIAGKQNRLGGEKGTVKGKPKKPHVGTYFKRGWWTDSKDKPIKEAHIGDTIRFHIQTKDIPDGESVNFTVFDWDGAFNLDDKVNLVIVGTTTEYNKLKITGNKGYIEWTTGAGTQKMIDEEGDDEIELYVECRYKDEKVEMPLFSDDYLILSEKEVKITVFVELPHSSYSTVQAIKNLDPNEALSAKGLAGHSAMAIGERYFDYGPDYDLNKNGKSGDKVKISEKDYDYDFNNDGDKDDIVDYQEKRDPMFSPGRPWWGEMVAKKLNIKPIDVKINQVLDFIKLHWKRDETGIYGEVNQIEFYVKQSEANKMLVWWEERYKHLKVYSVLPWYGEQCTTAVKSAIQQAYPFEFGKIKNNIADDTQKPSGLLSELKKFKSTSKQNKNKYAVARIIKKESIDFVK